MTEPYSNRITIKVHLAFSFEFYEQIARAFLNFIIYLIIIYYLNIYIYINIQYVVNFNYLILKR